MQNVFLTASLTVIGGIIVFTSGQLISKFTIEPLYNQKKVIGRIADLLIFYANVYSNPGTGKPEHLKAASEETRKLASELVARTVAIPFYRLWNKLGLVHSLKDVREAQRNLIGLSNSTYKGDPLVNASRTKKIEDSLGIPTEFRE